MEQKINDDIRRWTKDTVGKLKSSESKLGIKHSPGSNWHRTGFGSRSGLINRISFKMPRHAIFVHKGVGRGTPISKVGSTNRKPKPWFNPVIDENLNRLADSVSENAADLIVNNINIK